MSISIFDQHGRPRDLSGDADVAAIEALPDDHRETLFACLAAITAQAEADARMVAARNRVRELEAATQSDGRYAEPVTVTTIGEHTFTSPARNADQKFVEHAAAMRAVSAAQRPGYVPAKPVKDKNKEAMVAAENAVLEARAELIRSTAELRAAQQKSGLAIDAWRKCLPVMSRDTLMKDHVARGQAERAARVARGECPEPPRPAPKYLSEIDRVRGVAKPKPPRPLIR
jgi:hypothetical protein